MGEALVIDDYEDIELFLDEQVNIDQGEEVSQRTFKGFETNFRRVFPDLFDSLRDFAFYNGSMTQSTVKVSSLFSNAGLEECELANKNNVTGALNYLSFFPDDILEVTDDSPKKYRLTEDFFEVAEQLEQGLQRWESREHEIELVEDALTQYKDADCPGNKVEFASDYLEDRLGYTLPEPSVKEHIFKLG